MNFEVENLTMRVIFVCGEAQPGLCGVGDYCNRLSYALNEVPGIEALVIDLVKTGKLTQSIDSFKKFYRFMNFDMNRWEDILHFQFPSQGYGKSWLPYFFPLLSRICGARKIFVSLHEPILNPLLTFLLRAGAKCFVLVEENFRAKSGLAGKLIFCGTKTVAIPVGSNLPQPEPNLKSKLSKPRSKTLLVFFGFIARGKGLLHLIEAVDTSKHDLVIMGRVATGEEKFLLQLRDKLSKKGFVANRVLVGEKSPEEASNLIALADVVVLPFEGGLRPASSGSYLAARQAGTVVVSTKVGQGTPKFTKENMTIVVNAGSITSLRAGIELASEVISQFPDKSPISREHPQSWNQIALAHLATHTECSQKLSKAEFSR